MPETNHERLLEQIHNQMISEFSKTLEMFDLSPSDARLFVTLYINKKPMTLDEMSHALGKSKTSMSTGIRSLLDSNLVERVWKKGVRKDLYQANENLYRKFMRTYVDKWLDAADRQKQSLKEIKTQLKQQTKSEEVRNFEYVQSLQKRIEDMIKFHYLIEETFQDMDPNDPSTNS
ncbi:DNA-binding transcriptional regulator GbsR (MarR family) [Salirhabdus euzebyi]|uniref:HTH-type transcriptional regulator n=1 Tax=Salirhabdus euzebyi TaxID=394506 RepID=A0A841Q888_9BACI|nr:helix-turn-helix domain-containing protein [Salirhabdus euzebyi]MBB6454671.1 DNA-binding transcriptional regulator GbsR (MarR family) [Salirhabdus euzebyi]